MLLKKEKREKEKKNNKKRQFTDLIASNNSFYQYNFYFQTRPMGDTVSQFAKGYEDYLQCPLQPLMDNLESQTYEIFEKDPIKYSQYQKV